MDYTLSPQQIVAPAERLSARRWRLIAFIAIAAFMVGGPVAEQIGGLRSPYIRSWIMFSAPGIGLVDASFTIRQADGSFARLDRFDALGEQRDGKLRRINRDELTEIITRLCAAEGPGADIRVVARLAVRKGWRTLEAGDQNVCAR
jgi:hypothetical protein